MLDINELDRLMQGLEECYNLEKNELNKAKFLEILNKKISKALSDLDYYENKLEKCKSKLKNKDKEYLNEIKKTQLELDDVINNLDNLEGKELVKAENSIVYLNEKINKIIKNHSKVHEIYNLEKEVIKNKELYELYNFYINKIEEMADK